MKAVVIGIRGAGIFQDPHLSHTKDKVYDLSGKNDRTRYIKVPGGKISFGHIANLLRVLCGQRPVPQIRKVGFSGDPMFEEWARKVRVSVTTPTNKKGFYPQEMLTTRKTIGDSWQTATHGYFLDGKVVPVKGGMMHWDRLCRYLGSVLFGDFVSVVRVLSGGAEFTGQGSIEYLNTKKSSHEVVELCSRLKDGKKTSLVNIILNTKPESITFHSMPSCPLNLVMACSGPEQIQKFDAILYVPAGERELSLLSQGTGTATFTEGGVVSIEDVEDWSEELINIQTEPTVEGEYVSN